MLQGLNFARSNISLGQIIHKNKSKMYHQRNIRERNILQEYVLSSNDRRRTGPDNSWGGRYIDDDPEFTSTSRNDRFDNSNSILALDVETIELNRMPYPARGMYQMKPGLIVKIFYSGNCELGWGCRIR